MSIFKTRTPYYQGEGQPRPEDSQPFSLPDFVRRLMRTATPAYRSKTPPEPPPRRLVQPLER